MNDAYHRDDADAAGGLRWDRRWLTLLGDCCNGTLDGRQTDQLNRLLCTDARFRTLYTDYMQLHASLYSESAGMEEIAMPESTSGRTGAVRSGLGESGLGKSSIGGANDPAAAHAGSTSAPTMPGPIPIGQDSLDWPPEKVTRRTASQRPRRLSPYRFLSHSSYFILAGILVGVALVSSWLTFRLTRPGAMAPAVAAKERDAAGDPIGSVARITATYNCLWDSSAASAAEVGYGTPLAAGQRLQLREGLVEVTFRDGATVLLEGPASFVVDATDRFDLQTGRLAAVVPEHARGFRVHTRVLDVFDVGTEFGLLAQQSGTTELHVFNGLVKADVLDSEGHARRRLALGSNEAARIHPVSAAVEEFPADGDKFIRNMLPSAGPHDGLLAYESFDYPAGPLAAQNGGFGWAGPWFNIAADEDSGPDSNRVGSGSLTTTGMVPLGNRALQVAQHNRIRRALACSVGGVFDAAGLVENQDGVRLVGRDGNTIYLSFAQRVTATGDGFYGLELHRGDGNANRVLSIGGGAEGTGYGASSNVNAYGPGNFPALGEETTEVNFFVVKISFGVDNRDTVEIFRNPVSLRDEQACTVDAVLKGNFAFDRISLGNFDGQKLHEVDEIRVGTHFLAVTGRWGGNRGRLLRQITYRRPVGHGLETTCWPASRGIRGAGYCSRVTKVTRIRRTVGNMSM